MKIRQWHYQPHIGLAHGLLQHSRYTTVIRKPIRTERTLTWRYKVGTRALIHLVTITISLTDVKSPLVLSLLYSSGFQPPGICEETTVHENNHRSWNSIDHTTCNIPKGNSIHTSPLPSSYSLLILVLKSSPSFLLIPLVPLP